MLNPDCGVYTITSPSGRQYVGSAVSFRKRWWRHLRDLRKNEHHCAPLQRAFNKYGETALRFDIVALVPRADLLKREQEQIDARSRRRLYNTLPTAGSHDGAKRSPESCERIRLSKLAQPREVWDKIGASNTGKAKRTNKSGYCGVYLDKRGGKWRAQAALDGDLINLGSFDTPEAAAQARADFDAARARAGRDFMYSRPPRRLNSNNVSGIKGVYFEADKGKWRAEIRVAGKQKKLGRFDTKDAAAAAIEQFKATL